MRLISLLIIPFAGAIACYLAERLRSGSGRIVALLTSVALIIATVDIGLDIPSYAPTYFLWTSLPWSPSAGISFTLGMDGLGFILVALSALINIIAVGCSWFYINKKPGAFYFCMLWVIGGTLGVFMAHDLFLFYFFWEMMLIPMYFLIGVWGHDEVIRLRAAIKFFLYTFIGGLFLLAAILGLYWIHGQQSGVYTFDYNALLTTHLTLSQQTWLLAGFFIGFAVKLPIFGLHTWLPDAHTEAPTGGSIDLAGLLLKTGAYGLIRFAIPFCPEAWAHFGYAAGVLGIVGIFYGAFLAFAQNDMKRLIAYSSISHMGFILLALAANNTIAGQGAVMQMVAHGLSSGALFALVGMIDERYHTRNLNELGGLWQKLPRLSGFVIFFAIASLGLPGLGNFVAEFLTLVGTYAVWPSLAIIGGIGLFFAAAYTLKMIGQSIYGSYHLSNPELGDLSPREWSLLAPLCIGLIWLGLLPGTMLRLSETWWEQTFPHPPALIEAMPTLDQGIQNKSQQAKESFE